MSTVPPTGLDTGLNFTISGPATRRWTLPVLGLMKKGDVVDVTAFEPGAVVVVPAPAVVVEPGVVVVVLPDPELPDPVLAPPVLPLPELVAGAVVGACLAAVGDPEHDGEEPRRSSHQRSPAGVGVVIGRGVTSPSSGLAPSPPTSLPPSRPPTPRGHYRTGTPTRLLLIAEVGFEDM